MAKQGRVSDPIASFVAWTDGPRQTRFAGAFLALIALVTLADLSGIQGTWILLEVAAAAFIGVFAWGIYRAR